MFKFLEFFRMSSHSVLVPELFTGKIKKFAGTCKSNIQSVNLDLLTCFVNYNLHVKVS